MAKKYTKTSPLLREMQTKSTVKYYLVLLKMVCYPPKTENKHWRRYGEIRSLVRCWSNGKRCGQCGKRARWYLQHLKIELPMIPQSHFWVHIQKN